MLDPKEIPKYVNQLSIPPVFAPKIVRNHWAKKIHQYVVDVSLFEQQILPEGFPKTSVIGYGGYVKIGNKKAYTQQTPGPTFYATRGIPIKVKWVNKLDERHFLPIDGTIHWANPNHENFPPRDYPKPFNPETREGIPAVQKPIPIVTHLHGAETSPQYDGHPDAWFTNEAKKKGKAYVTDTYHYLNAQPPATLWYHDHTLGMTRQNVYAGLSGFYLLHDRKDSLNHILPAGEFDIPLAIQDRSFFKNGQLAMDNIGTNPKIHPYWTPENLGNTIMVNGKVWPNLNVKRGQYRFRLLNGSNARFYRINLLKEGSHLSFIQIASDGGYLPFPIEITELTLAPGQRAEILVDFSHLPPGTSIEMKNDAPAPFNPNKPPLNPNDPAVDIMQFTVITSFIKKMLPLPAKLNAIPSLTPNAPKRILTLNELSLPEGSPLMLLLNGQKWSAPISEQPLVGSTEDWEFINLTVDTHPMHLHLVQFQVIGRQMFDKERYLSDWLALNGNMPFEQLLQTLSTEKYLIGSPIPPLPNEQGWNDVVMAHPGEITTIRVRFAPIRIGDDYVKPGENKYPFNPGKFPGYVWHCHILDHEDNEMMRPYEVFSQTIQNRKTRVERLAAFFTKRKKGRT